MKQGLRLGAVLVLALMFAGCGGGSGGAGAVAGAPFAGRVDGGGPQSPISGATIMFYAMTINGYGAGGLLATATSNSSGGFTISSYTCPSATTETYVIAMGGNAGAGTNSAIGLMALTGQCGSLNSSSVVVMNELTTVAAAWELAQFSDSTGTNFGTSPSNTTGLDNAVNQTTSDLVTSVGTSPSSAGIPARLMPSAAQCSASSPPVNCDGLERLDTLANILASCINSSGPSSTQCSTLFSNTNNSTTTLEAAHYIVTNPTTNVAAIYGISPPAGMTLFSPTLSSAPSTWTLALNFAATGANFSGPYGVAVDSSGNVWVTNYNGSTVTELDSSGGLIGDYAPSGGNISGPQGLALDSSGNVWVANESGNSVTELNSSGGLVGNYAPSGSNLNIPYMVAVDSSGNLWLPNEGSNAVTELNSSGGLVGSYDPSSTFNGPLSVALDSSGNVWVANSNTNTVVELNSSGALVGNYSPSGSGLNYPFAVALDSSSNVWAANYSGNTVTELNSSGALVGNYSPSGANFNGPAALAVDSAGNVWVANSSGNTVTELNSSGALVGNYAPSGASFSLPIGVAVDSSGNVWVPNFNGNSVAELLGAASPVTTPLGPGGPVKP